MAVVNASITIRDDKNRTKNTPMRFARGTLTLANMSAMVNNYCALLVPVIDGLITEATITIPVALSGAITTVSGFPAVGSDADVGASLSLLNSANVRDTIYIPTFAHALGSKDIALTGNADIEALVDAWVAGVTDGTTVNPLVDPNELDITQVVRGFRSKRK